MAGNIPTGEVLTSCSCKNDPGKICGYCMRESQIEAKRRKNKWRGN